MYLKKIIFPLLLVIFSNINAQKREFGKVTIEELQQKQHPKDTAAVAAILFEKGTVYFEDLVTITNVKTKIKIYKKEGFSWANKEIFYYLQGENVSFSNAITYNLVDGKIEKIKLKTEGEFFIQTNKYIGQKKITLPNAREGSIIEFEYKIRSGNFGSLRDWYFQTSIPTDFSEYKVISPNFLIFNKRTKGFLYPKQTVGSAYNEENSTIFTLENVPAMKEEALVNNIDNYRTCISYELAMVDIPGRVYQTLSTNWNDIAKKIYEFDDFGIELNKSGYFEYDLKAFTKGLTNQNEIISTVLDFVKSNVKWNDNYGYSCDNGVKKAYKDKIGNVAEINLMLTAMLRSQGLDANPVLVSTRSNGIALFPSRTAFNYVIAAVETSSGLILLDATNKFTTPNILPFRDLNWYGRLIRKDGSSENVDLMPQKISNNQVMMMYSIDPTGKITGKLIRQKTDYNAFSFRSDNENINEEDYLEKLENENGKIDITDYSRSDMYDLKIPITENCSFTGENLCEIIGEKIYINPMLFFTKESNVFKQENREYPVDFGFPFMDKYNISIDIPEGYEVEQIPKSTQLSMEEDIGGFKFIVDATKKKIQLIITHQINTPIVSSKQYSILKEYYKEMIDKEKEKIILKKV